MTETMSVSEFKAKCLAVLDQVAKTRQDLVLTRRGKPIARIVPSGDEQPDTNPLKDSIVYEDDIVSPIGAPWDAAS